jgi:MoxR-like ATPase
MGNVMFKYEERKMTELTKVITKRQSGNTLKEIKSVIKLAQELKDSVYIWGEPGIGKSAVIAQAAAELGLELVDIRLAMRQAVDFIGLPVINQGRTEWATPSIFPTDPAWRGIIFLDEMNQASPEMLKASYQLINDRGLASYRLPDGAVVAAASNEPSEFLDLEEIPGPLANRFTHINVKVDLDQWIDWANKNGINKIVVGFIENQHPELLVDRARMEKNERVFATPRSWEKVSKIMNSSADAKTKRIMIEGRVGRQIAVLLEEYEKTARNNKEADAILAGEEVKIDEQLRSEFYNILISLSLKMKDSASHAHRVMTFIESLKSSSNKTIAVKMLVDKIKKHDLQRLVKVTQEIGLQTL